MGRVPTAFQRVGIEKKPRRYTATCTSFFLPVGAACRSGFQPRFNLFAAGSRSHKAAPTEVISAEAVLAGESLRVDAAEIFRCVNAAAACVARALRVWAQGTGALDCCIRCDLITP